MFAVVSEFNLTGGLPKGSVRQALDAEIAGEGGKVVGDKGDTIILSNGDQVAWTPPPETPVIPDLSKVKSLRMYFAKRGHEVYPAWLYHQDGRSALVRNAKESAEYGIVYRKATVDERNRYGLKDVWDWEQGVQWRPTPWADPKFDPAHPGAGKEVVHRGPDAKVVQQDLVAAVAAAVAQALKASGPSAPASVDPNDWQQFLAFKAWQETQKAVAQLDADNVLQSGDDEIAEEAFDPPSDEELASNALSPEQDRLLWEQEGRRLGVKVDGRWSLERLKAEVQAAIDKQPATA